MAKLKVRYWVEETWEIIINDPGTTPQKLAEMLRDGRAKWNPAPHQNVIHGTGYLQTIKDRDHTGFGFEKIEVE